MMFGKNHFFRVKTSFLLIKWSNEKLNTKNNKIKYLVVEIVKRDVEYMFSFLMVILLNFFNW